MRHSLLDDFSVEELNKLLEESGTQKRLAERLEVSPALISKYIGKRRAGGGKPKMGWTTKVTKVSSRDFEDEPVTPPPVVEKPAWPLFNGGEIKTVVRVDNMDVNVTGELFSYTVMRDHIEVWSGTDGIQIMYDEIPKFYVELSDALKVADKLHGVLKPYMQENTDVGQDQP